MTSKQENESIGTKAVHSGYEPDRTVGAIMPPIYMTSTFIQEAPGQSLNGYEYTRGGNPNFTALEGVLASLEGAKYATIFSSGLGALTSLLLSLNVGDKVLAIEGLYGGTYRLLHAIFSRFGIDCMMLPDSLEGLDDALTKKPKWLIFETPTNPLLGIYDIEKLTSKARQNGVFTLVDNTFATPVFQTPLRFGATAVWHSTTKYIGGHSDVIGGVIATNDTELKQKLDFSRMAAGLNPSPFDAWLTMRGVKTLPIRMEKHATNAQALVNYLTGHPQVKKVYYPGLSTHPRHEIAKKQMHGFGGMISVEFNLSYEQVMRLITSFRLFALAESLGGVESLVNHPATMTHASIPPEVRRKQGLSDSLVRFSVGIEGAEDLIDDLDKALAKL